MSMSTYSSYQKLWSWMSMVDIANSLVTNNEQRKHAGKSHTLTQNGTNDSGYLYI